MTVCALSSGELTVWATIYAQKREYGKSVVEAVRLAALEIKNIRSLGEHSELLDTDGDAHVMLDDVLGRDRK